jgi:hypothetical protein
MSSIIDVWQGNEVQIGWDCYTKHPDAGGLPINLTDATAVFLAKEKPSDPDEAAVITGTTENGKIEIYNGPNGKLSMTIGGEDSEALTAASCGCPWRDFFCQFAAKLSTDQILRSAPFVLRYHSGAIQTFQ